MRDRKVRRRPHRIGGSAAPYGSLNGFGWREMAMHAIALLLIIVTHSFSGVAFAQSANAVPPAGLATTQISGRGFEEGLEDGDRFQLRAFIWSLEGATQSVLGPDVSLFEPNCVAQFGRGVQCAQLLVVGNGYFLETFDTSSPDLVGHDALRFAGETWRVYFDPAPDGTRTFEDLPSFEKGDPVAVYQVREFATADAVADFVLARNDLVLITSRPFTLKGVTIDFKNVAPRLMGLGHARVPQPDPNPQPIPINEAPFQSKGPGFFLLHTAISGTFSAVDAK